MSRFAYGQPHARATPCSRSATIALCMLLVWVCWLGFTKLESPLYHTAPQTFAHDHKPPVERQLEDEPELEPEQPTGPVEQPTKEACGAQRQQEQDSTETTAREGGETKRVPWSDDIRVAWVMPFLSSLSMPNYASFCFRTIAALSPYLHLFVFYENETMVLPDVHSDNIHYISLGEDGIVNRIVKELRRGLGPNVTEEATAEVKTVFAKRPRYLGRYKLLFASAFEEYIGNYSHWAWGDLDTLIGDVVGLVSEKDLRSFDAISFSRDVGHLYLQGQLTILSNRPYMRTIWPNATKKVWTLATSQPEYAWGEVHFSEWAIYHSDLHIKIMPLHLTANVVEEWSPLGYDQPNRSRVVWDNGRLLQHSPYAPPSSSFPEVMDSTPLRFQSTWTSEPQRDGPWIMERRGSNDRCLWTSTRRKTPGYDERTQEFVVFHFSYEHEGKIPNALEKKGPKELQTLLEGTSFEFQYDPFDFVPMAEGWR